LRTVASSCSDVGFGCAGLTASLRKGNAVQLRLAIAINPMRVARLEMSRLDLVTAFTGFTFIAFSSSELLSYFGHIAARARSC
jgi:hypothetical protein